MIVSLRGLIIALFCSVNLLTFFKVANPDPTKIIKTYAILS